MNDDVEHSGRHGIRNRKRNDGSRKYGAFRYAFVQTWKEEREDQNSNISQPYVEECRFFFLFSHHCVYSENYSHSLLYYEAAGDMLMLIFCFVLFSSFVRSVDSLQLFCLLEP